MRYNIKLGEYITGTISLSVQRNGDADLDIYARQNSGAAMSINTYWQAVRII